MIFDNSEERIGLLGSFLRKVIEVDVNKIEQAYRKFHDESLGIPSGKEVWNRNDFSLKAATPRYSDIFNIGIDIPLYFRKEGNEKAVILLGEDPLRNENIPNESILSTPFALHMNSNRPTHKMISTIVSSLLERGFNVYVTDVFKVWIKGGPFKENLFKDKLLLENSLACLKSEFSMIKKDNQENNLRLITLGSKAHQAFKQLEAFCDVKSFNWLHPAARQKHFINGENNMKISKQEYYSKMLKQL